MTVSRRRKWEPGRLRCNRGGPAPSASARCRIRGTSDSGHANTSSTAPWTGCTATARPGSGSSSPSHPTAAAPPQLWRGAAQHQPQSSTDPTSVPGSSHHTSAECGRHRVQVEPWVKGTGVGAPHCSQLENFENWVDAISFSVGTLLLAEEMESVEENS